MGRQDGQTQPPAAQTQMRDDLSEDTRTPCETWSKILRALPLRPPAVQEASPEHTQEPANGVY